MLPGVGSKCSSIDGVISHPFFSLQFRNVVVRIDGSLSWSSSQPNVRNIRALYLVCSIKHQSLISLIHPAPNKINILNIKHLIINDMMVPVSSAALTQPQLCG